ncbi:hypothetical protein EDB92DRAFT_216991 [Lactarius akahatsu]|uniref:Uncharacterized protein n=1 Tax=Lactarius akahatsu TaxID=416441 RepID=A0AAD4Q8L7_9AGAM|nr:hypothetical protein EDB92DRAFT_216991 [Lactarius akahatsu]
MHTGLPCFIIKMIATSTQPQVRSRSTESGSSQAWSQAWSQGNRQGNRSQITTNQSIRASAPLMPTPAPTKLCSPTLIASILRTVPASIDTFGQTRADGDPVNPIILPISRRCPPRRLFLRSRSRLCGTSSTAHADARAQPRSSPCRRNPSILPIPHRRPPPHSLRVVRWIEILMAMRARVRTRVSNQDMVRYSRMRDGLASVAVSEPVPASLAYGLQPGLHGWAWVFDMPARWKVSMHIRVRGNGTRTYIRLVACKAVKSS